MLGQISHGTVEECPDYQVYHNAMKRAWDGCCICEPPGWTVSEIHDSQCLDDYLRKSWKMAAEQFENKPYQGPRGEGEMTAQVDADTLDMLKIMNMSNLPGVKLQQV
jgi:hypothetical protein